MQCFTNNSSQAKSVFKNKPIKYKQMKHGKTTWTFTMVSAHYIQIFQFYQLINKIGKLFD